MYINGKCWYDVLIRMHAVFAVNVQLFIPWVLAIGHGLK